MVNIQTLVASVVSVYGVKGLGIAAKYGIVIAKQRLGEKKFNRVATDCKVAVKALWDLNETLGLDELEKAAVRQVVGTNKYKDLQLVEETVKNVVASMASQPKVSSDQPTQVEAAKTEQVVQQ
jgi:hypothetical protein